MGRPLHCPLSCPLFLTFGSSKLPTELPTVSIYGSSGQPTELLTELPIVSIYGSSGQPNLHGKIPMGSPRAAHSVAYVQPTGSEVGSSPVFSVWATLHYMEVYLAGEKHASVICVMFCWCPCVTIHCVIH